ncbi:MAG: hypothetical protein JOS17DRAFT_755535 [Linnemannia elongata]|nr:MAG: hypothetical protein JOS17DRAFT_755535 [Linnemannia elongata]
MDDLNICFIFLDVLETWALLFVFAVYVCLSQPKKAQKETRVFSVGHTFKSRFFNKSSCGVFLSVSSVVLSTCERSIGFIPWRVYDMIKRRVRV